MWSTAMGVVCSTHGMKVRIDVPVSFGGVTEATI